MGISAEEIKSSVAACGLVCGLCADRQAGCQGCGNTGGPSCDILTCCADKGVNWCFECGDYPCGSLPAGERQYECIRVRAINRVAKEEGLDRLCDYLKRNYDAGIRYHRVNGENGDYDLPDEQAAISLIRGRIVSRKA